MVIWGWCPSPLFLLFQSHAPPFTMAIKPMKRRLSVFTMQPLYRTAPPSWRHCQHTRIAHPTHSVCSRSTAPWSTLSRRVREQPTGTATCHAAAAATEVQELQQGCSLLWDSKAITTCMTITAMLWKLLIRMVFGSLGGEVPTIAQLVLTTANQLLLAAWIGWWGMYTALAWRFEATNILYVGYFILAGVMLPLAYCCSVYSSLTPCVVAFGMAMSMMLTNFTETVYSSRQKMLQNPYCVMPGEWDWVDSMLSHPIMACLVLLSPGVRVSVGPAGLEHFGLSIDGGTLIVGSVFLCCYFLAVACWRNINGHS